MIRVDAALFAAAQAGEPVALERMLRELQPDIRRYARRQCHRTTSINRTAAFAPCRIVVGGSAGGGGHARLPGLLDDRTGRSHSTVLWGDSKLSEGVLE